MTDGNRTVGRTLYGVWVMIVVWTLGTYVAASASDDRPAGPTFGQYYEPYELSIAPNAPGYSLPLNVANITNYDQVSSQLGLSGEEHLIEGNGFAVVAPAGVVWDDIVEPYTFLTDQRIPLFLTTDTVLHLYHIQFDETLKDIEEREFIADVNDLTAALLGQALLLYDEVQADIRGHRKPAALRNVAYLAVAQKLMDPNAGVPDAVSDIVAEELALIGAHEGFVASPLFIYEEDYSQYVPRGHYTRSEPLKRYFKTMMWYGRMAFLLKGSIPWGRDEEALISPADADIQTFQAALLAKWLEDVEVGDRTGLDVWNRLYGVTAFYVGLADDLTPYDYLWALDQVFTGGDILSFLAHPDNVLALKTELALLPSPRIFGGTGNATAPPGAPPEFIYEILDKSKGLRLMGQRFIPDSYMFQHLVFPQVDLYTGDPAQWPFTKAPDGNRRLVRGYPRGLDVMALLGSKQALHILIDEGDTDYVDFWTRFGELKHEFDAFSVSDWNQNLYWSWLYSLKALVTDLPQGYPSFMRTAAWQRRSLSAALASWTELRHDTILYAKQSYTPVGRAAPVSPPPGYIEPAGECFGRLLALTRMTRAGLSDMEVLSATAAERLTGLEDMLARILEIVEKELLNQPLSPRDASYIQDLARLLEFLITGVEPKGLKTTLVADVHTHIFEEKVVEEAAGNVDLLVVACPLPGSDSAFLAAGPVLSYYEFKHDMSDRLTDEAWREMLDSADAPDRPAWYVPLMGRSTDEMIRR